MLTLAIPQSEPAAERKTSASRWSRVKMLEERPCGTSLCRVSASSRGVVGQDVEDRCEGLLPHHVVLFPDADQGRFAVRGLRGGVGQPAAAPGQQLAPRRTGPCQRAVHLLQGRERDQRTDQRALVERVADRQRAVAETSRAVSGSATSRWDEEAAGRAPGRTDRRGCDIGGPRRTDPGHRGRSRGGAGAHPPRGLRDAAGRPLRHRRRRDPAARAPARPGGLPGPHRTQSRHGRGRRVRRGGGRLRGAGPGPGLPGRAAAARRVAVRAPALPRAVLPRRTRGRAARPGDGRAPRTAGAGLDPAAGRELLRPRGAHRLPSGRFRTAGAARGDRHGRDPGPGRDRGGGQSRDGSDAAAAPLVPPTSSG